MRLKGGILGHGVDFKKPLSHNIHRAQQSSMYSKNISKIKKKNEENIAVLLKLPCNGCEHVSENTFSPFTQGFFFLLKT